jgi:hypothetical protein
VVVQMIQVPAGLSAEIVVRYTVPSDGAPPPRFVPSIAAWPSCPAPPIRHRRAQGG